MAYAVMDDLETVSPGRGLTGDERKTIADAKDVLARQYIELTLKDCKFDSGHESEFFGDQLQADIIAYHRRGDDWSDADRAEEEGGRAHGTGQTAPCETR